MDCHLKVKPLKPPVFFVDGSTSALANENPARMRPFVAERRGMEVFTTALQQEWITRAPLLLRRAQVQFRMENRQREPNRAPIQSLFRGREGRSIATRVLVLRISTKSRLQASSSPVTRFRTASQTIPHPAPPRPLKGDSAVAGAQLKAVSPDRCPMKEHSAQLALYAANTVQCTNNRRRSEFGIAFCPSQGRKLRLSDVLE